MSQRREFTVDKLVLKIFSQEPYVEYLKTASIRDEKPLGFKRWVQAVLERYCSSAEARQLYRSIDDI